MIFVNQTALKLILKTNVNFNTYLTSEIKIKYKDPAGTTSEFVAAELSGSEAEGKIFVDFSDSIKFTVAGKYILWAEITFTDSTFAHGEAVVLMVYTPGSDH